MVSFSSVVSKLYNVIMYFVENLGVLLVFFFCGKKAKGYLCFSDSFLLQV